MADKAEWGRLRRCLLFLSVAPMELLEDVLDFPVVHKQCHCSYPLDPSPCSPPGALMPSNGRTGKNMVSDWPLQLLQKRYWLTDN
jgi:hypothetical protein